MPYQPPSVPVVLNETSFRLFYEGANRYVYRISLRAEPGFVLSPCTPSRRHRWKIVHPSSCSTTAGISNSTINALTSMLNDYQWAANSLYVDVHLQWSGYSGNYNGYNCDASDDKTIGMILALSRNEQIVCYEHIHPDEGNIYDFTYWTRPDTHPGNAAASAAGHLHPITKWADYNNTFTLPFPSWHTMDRWDVNKGSFDYVGRYYDTINFMDLPSILRTQSVANMFTPPDILNETAQSVVVCGSHGEISNNSSMTNVFSFAMGEFSIFHFYPN